MLLQSYGDLIIFLTGTDDVDELICAYTLQPLMLVCECVTDNLLHSGGCDGLDLSDPTGLVCGAERG